MTTDELNAKLLEVSGEIFPPGLTLRHVDPRTLIPQPVNARWMKEPMFTQLVENIRKVGALESFPLCVENPAGIAIISGHHRVKAAIAGQLAMITVIVYDSLEQPEIVAKQLAHNSISGQDKLEDLQTLFGQIADDAALVAEAHIDPSIFEDPTPKEPAQKPADVDMTGAVKSVLITFLPSQFEHIDAYVKQLTADKHADVIYLAHTDAFEAWVTAFQEHAGTAEVSVVPTAIADMAKLAKQAHELGLVQPGNWVPLATMFHESGGAVPPEVADVIRQAVQKMVDDGNVSPDSKWQALEYMAAEILGRP